MTEVESAPERADVAAAVSGGRAPGNGNGAANGSATTAVGVARDHSGGAFHTATERLRDMIARLDNLRRGTHTTRSRLEVEAQMQRQRAAVIGDRLQDAVNVLEQTRSALEPGSGGGADLLNGLRAAEERLLQLTARRTSGGEGSLSALRAAHTAELTRLRGEQEQLAARFAQVQHELAAVREKASADEGRLIEERLALLTQVKGLKKYLGERSDECARLLGDMRRAKEKSTGLEQAIGELRQAQGDAVAESARWKTRVQELEQSLVAAQDREDKRVISLERDLGAAAERMTLLEKNISEIRDSLEKERDVSASLRAEIRNYSRVRQGLEADLVEARGKAAEVQSRLQYESQQHATHVTKSSERISGLENERNKLQEEVASLMAVKERLEREFKNARRQAELDQQKMELAKLHAKMEAVAWAHPDAQRAAAGGPSEPPEVRARVPAQRPVGTQVVESALADLPIVAIGASTGGPAALGEVLPILPANFAGCVLIVQHMPPGYTAELAAHLDQQASLTVVEARHGDVLRPGMAFVAPGGHHMEVRGAVIRLSAGPPVNKQRPAVDVLFDSLVPLAKRVQAVLLTGMGHDGAAGMARLRAAGAETVVQDEASSVVWGMPGSAVKAGCAGLQLTPTEIGKYLVSQVGTSESVPPAQTVEVGEIAAAVAAVQQRAAS